MGLFGNFNINLMNNNAPDWIKKVTEVFGHLDYEDQAIKVNGEIRPLEYSTGFSIDIIAYYKKKDLVLEFTTGFKTIEKLQEKCPNTDWELLKMKVDRCNLIRTIKRI